MFSFFVCKIKNYDIMIYVIACVAELVDAHDSKSCDSYHVGSIPTKSTIDVSVRTFSDIDI